MVIPLTERCDGENRAPRERGAPGVATRESRDAGDDYAALRAARFRVARGLRAGAFATLRVESDAYAERAIALTSLPAASASVELSFTKREAWRCVTLLSLRPATASVAIGPLSR